MKTLRIILELTGFAVICVMGLVLWIEFTRDRNPRLPSYAFHYDSQVGYVKVQGSWILEDEQSGFPIQTTTILCVRDTLTCIEATAILPDPKFLFPVELNVLTVTKWDDDAIAFEGQTAQCISYSYLISIRTQTATGLRKRRSDVSDLICQQSDPRPLRMRMVGGEAIPQLKQ